MGNRILFLGAEFSSGLAQRGIVENRVIAKAVCSGAVFGYFAMEITFGGKGFSVRINENDCTGIMSFFVFFIFLWVEIYPGEL